jgi:Domain of unknown function (DUF4403)
MKQRHAISMRLRSSPILVVWLVALGLCGFEAPAPKRTPAPPPPPSPVSTVAATLKVSGDDIIAMLNARTKSQLARIEGGEVNCLIQKCQVDLAVVRSGDFTGEATGSGMHLKLPFALHAHLDFNSKFLRTGGDATAQGQTDTVTQLSLTPQWRIDSQTDGTVHLENAQLKLGPLKMSVRDLWNGNEDRLSGPIFKAIDKRIAAALKLRGQVERLWLKLQQPIRVGKKPESWLLMAPERLRITPLHTENGALVISVATDVRAHVVVGEKPVTGAPAKLPQPEKLQKPSDTFAVTVPVTLSYGDAAKIAMQQLRKKPLRAAGMNLRLDKLQIFPTAQDLVVQTHFCFGKNWDFTHLLDSCGDVYLRGAPHFDARTGKIQVTNLHYDVKSQNLMLRVVQALAGDALAGLIQPHLVFDESREIAKIKGEIAAAIEKPQGRGIVLAGRIESFSDPTVFWTNSGFVALLRATGTVRTSLNVKTAS